MNAIGAVQGALLTALILAPGKAQAQQLEPRAYSPAPTGMNFLGLITGYASGGVLTDPSLPIDNAHAIVYVAAPYYGRTFGVFGRLANATVAIPYGWATAHGDVQDVSRQVERSGLRRPPSAHRNESRRRTRR